MNNTQVPTKWLRTKALQTFAAMAVFLVSLSSASAEGTDKYSAVANQKLMLRSKISATFDASHVKSFYNTIGMKNFVIKDWNFNGEEVVNWCTDTAKDTEMRDGETTEQGEARGTLAALQNACGKIYSHQLTLTHACKTITKEVKKKQLLPVIRTLG